MSKKNPSVKELFDIVRRGMIWRGKPLENKVDRHKTARIWIEEQDIVPGYFQVKSSAMHDNYVKWCKERGLSGSAILGAVELGKFCIKEFESVRINNSTHYYVNKELKEDDEEKKKRKDKVLKRKADKTSKESN